MIFTTCKTNGHRAFIVKSMIGLAFCAVPAVAGNNGFVVRGDEVEASTLCTTTSTSIDLPAPSIVISTTDDVDAASGVSSVTPISPTESICAGESVTVSVTVTVTTLNSNEPMQTAGPPLSGSMSSSEDFVNTITEIVTNTGAIIETVTTSTSTEVETTTVSSSEVLPPFPASSISEQLSTVTTILSTNTATRILTATEPLSAKSTVWVSTTITVSTITVGGTAGTIGSIVPSIGHGSGNSSFTYSAPSASIVYPKTTYPAISAANNGGGRGAQAWYCIVMVVGVAMLSYTL
ncbi:hypothetical protein QBC36DRAFT_330041 [Triangularia setosa]|uniref:Uncharacterized protein n=1 Tax=Triangularia setosa TaxID=2587417 RepID=A0AAN6W642_9PEZI|nr:hypothetical protein QBC36DRAFT_330041 [Podospora setosa]